MSSDLMLYSIGLKQLNWTYDICQGHVLDCLKWHKTWLRFALRMTFDATSTCPTGHAVSLPFSPGGACPAPLAASGSPSWGWSACVSSRARRRRPLSCSDRSWGRRGRVWRSDSFPSRSAPAVYLEITPSGKTLVSNASSHTFFFFFWLRFLPQNFICNPQRITNKNWIIWWPHWQQSWQQTLEIIWWNQMFLKISIWHQVNMLLNQIFTFLNAF